MTNAETVGRLCQSRKHSGFTETPYNVFGLRHSFVIRAPSFFDLTSLAG